MLRYNQARQELKSNYKVFFLQKHVIMITCCLKSRNCAKNGFSKIQTIIAVQAGGWGKTRSY